MAALVPIKLPIYLRIADGEELDLGHIEVPSTTQAIHGQLVMTIDQDELRRRMVDMLRTAADHMETSANIS